MDATAGGPECAAQAAALVERLAAGDFPAVAAGFDHDLAQAMPPAQLAATWAALLSQVGAFEGTGEIRAESVGGYTMSVVRCRFARAGIDVQVAFQPRTGQIVGLGFVPAEPSAPPAAELAHLLSNHERAWFEARGGAAEAERYRRVVVVGGGAAGYLTALALQRQLPWVEVTLIESSTIPIIGVGEASVPPLLPFLHHFLGIDIHAFYRAVSPTWKAGIRFEWGAPGAAFQAPFDWDINDVGIVGSLAATGGVSAATLGAVLMAAGRSPIVRDDAGGLRSLLPTVPLAYHIDTGRFVAFLHELALARGIRHLDCKITEVVVGPSGELVEALVTSDGRRLDYDLYVDCSGFRSLLLEQGLHTPFISYQQSLFTDRALAFNTPHNGQIKPYTTATTMDSGWCWNIPMRDDDHCGYVYASRFCSDDQALAEVGARFGEVANARVVQFRSGRHQQMWRGNVAAIGNSYAFVEPLESTGLLMITNAIGLLVDALRAGRPNQRLQRVVNDTIASSWDRLRWFLSIHFKFNRAKDTAYWREARAATDVSGLEAALELFREGAPLALRPRSIRQRVASIIFYEVAGLDCILLGQGVPARLLQVDEAAGAWQARHQAAMRLAARALTQREALAVIAERPELLDAQLADEQGWVRKLAARL